MIKPKYFLMFFGYQRSGHSFVGALLDSHKNVIISDECHVLMRYKNWSQSKDKIFKVIQNNSKSKAKKSRSRRSQYLVENAYQGRYENELKLIGDKKGGQTSIYLTKFPKLLENFSKEIDLPIKFIHVIRNPFDMITTTKFRLEKKYGGNKNVNGIGSSFAIMFRKAEKLRKRKDIEFIDVYHEDVINNTGKEMKRILNFLGINEYPGFIKTCKNVVYKNPNKTRNQTKWTSNNINRVNKMIKNHEFLNRYSFDK